MTSTFAKLRIAGTYRHVQNVRRLYDTEQLRALLRQDNGSMAPPEFWEPQNLEYEVAHSIIYVHVFSRQSGRTGVQDVCLCV